MDEIIKVITSLGLPTALVLYYLWRNDRDKKEFSDKLELKDAENRKFTNRLVDNLHDEISELKEERRADKKTIQDAIDTNKLLSQTNSALHNAIIGVGSKIDNIERKVDKIEIILEKK